MKFSELPCIEDNCTKLVGPKGARRRCPSCYTKWLKDNNWNLPAAPRVDSGWPSDSDLLDLMATHKNFTVVADVCGRSRGSLRDYLHRRPGLNSQMRALMPQRLTDEEKAAKLRAAQRSWRRANPERVRELKRAWAAGRPADVRREQQRSTIEGRRDREAARPRLSAAELLLAAEYEGVLRDDPCSYCEASGGTIDHIVSVFDGGDDSVDNLTGACRSCNSSKRDKSVLDFMLWRLDHVS